MPPGERTRSSKRKATGPAADQRILELLLLLLDAGRPLSRSEIFEAIPGYRTGNPPPGERKFERDKKELRELGVPLDQPDPDDTRLRDRSRGV